MFRCMWAIPRPCGGAIYQCHSEGSEGWVRDAEGYGAGGQSSIVVRFLELCIESK
jgi:hypothetical protein